MIIRQATIICALCWCCVPSAPANSDNKVKIQGQIIYEPTGKPLKDVTVKLLRPHRELWTLIKNFGHEDVPDLLAVTKTDSDGRFGFETKERGPYEINCFRPGPHSGDGVLNVDPQKSVLIRYKADPVPFTLRPGEKPPKQ